MVFCTNGICGNARIFDLLFGFDLGNSALWQFLNLFGFIFGVCFYKSTFFNFSSLVWIRHDFGVFQAWLGVFLLKLVCGALFFW
ncbi:hypothetical protein BBW65_02090 [Helicobacter enhydrae]|uniref:Transmembrane protein n=1 Tax=Helicobacter enhydrae TaxID=222136 RepID=A0A1B1U4J1_9HELI|nr:hypothetical protein BBW65_02090 [Helicobacter enhydrae]